MLQHLHRPTRGNLHYNGVRFATFVGFGYDFVIRFAIRDDALFVRRKSYPTAGRHSLKGLDTIFWAHGRT